MDHSSQTQGKAANDSFAAFKLSHTITPTPNQPVPRKCTKIPVVLDFNSLITAITVTGQRTSIVMQAKGH